MSARKRSKALLKVSRRTVSARSKRARPGKAIKTKQRRKTAPSLVKEKDCWICHRDLLPGDRSALVPDQPIVQVCEGHKGRGGRLEWIPSSQYSDLSIVKRCRECKTQGTMCLDCYFVLNRDLGDLFSFYIKLKDNLEASVKSISGWQKYVNEDAAILNENK